MPKRSDLKVTKRVVDALSVEAKDAVFWDRDMPGFGVRVYATGRKVYVVQSRGPGGPKRVTLGRHGELSTDEARKQAAHVIDCIKRGEDTGPEPTEAELTVAGLAERFMRAHVKSHCKPGTALAYRSVIDVRILPALGTMTLDEVGRAEVSALHHSLRETPAMANAALGLLSKMFKMAEAWGLTPPGRNPCRGLRRYRVRSRERFLAPEEFRRLDRALKDLEAEGKAWPIAVAAIRLLVLTGCRRSEILDLRWDDVDHTTGEFRLRDAKAGPRMVPLTAPVKRVLEGVPRSPDNPWVIHRGNGKGRLGNLSYYWGTVREFAGLDDVRIHDLRHSYASRALALGESLSTIGKLLGHRHVVSTARYAHLMRDAEKAAANRVGESIGVHVTNGRVG
ncbi:MAG: tyrosine-type recombinase/integrase [Nitrospinae bacterium]|nr:tyrosine-type recombinase/integrase [Nitrospinota bacterium]